jgi:formate hydrogenlyase subunit 3/multisubunit Na+/H+ antiporter MnhD subunit
VSLTIFYGLMTLVPLALAAALAALGLARRATPAVGVALAVAGVVLPVAGLAWMAAEVSAGYPLEIALWGASSSWLAIYARADALSVYAGLGVAALVTPLLLWIAWRVAPPESAEATDDEESSAALDAPEADAPGLDAPEAEESADGEAAEEAAAEAGAKRAGVRSLRRWQWVGVALALALESFLLSLVFAENIIWFALTWLLVIGASWALGELGSVPQTLDWKGLAMMASPVVIWLIPTLLIAGPAGDQRLIDLMGAAKLPLGHVFVMTLAVALAAGAWPALGWMRKRASITTPAGLGAAALAVMPAALFAGARTYSIAQTASGGWPAFTLGKPPITIGVTLALLGAVTVLFGGLLALGRRDGRGLLASCAMAVAGWGLLGLGVGAPLAALGVTLLLATGILGLGAMLASLVASGAATADIEPDSAGPRIFGQPARPAALFAWVIGAATAVGLPLFAGFAPMQMISAAALPGARVVIPLVGLAWGGAALLLIGLLRATAPAFSAAPAVAAEEEAALAPASEDADGGEEGEGADTLAVAPASRPDLYAPDLPGIALGTLAVIVGVAPSTLLLIGSIPAAESFLQANALSGATQAQVAGYTAGASQWLATPAIVTLALVALALAVVRWRLPRSKHRVPIFLSGQGAVEPGEVEGGAGELAGLPEPADAWDDLLPALRSGWMTPGADWLGVTDETGAESLPEETPEGLGEEEADGASEAEATEAAEEPEPVEPVEEEEPAATAEAAEAPEAAETAEAPEAAETAEAPEAAEAAEAGEAAPAQERADQSRAMSGQGARKARGAKRGKRS